MATKSKKKISKTKIIDAYVEHLLLEGREPKTAFAFAKELGLNEEDFYNYFSSFKALEAEIWRDFMQKTLKSLNGDDSFEAFSVREKLLSFFFTHLEVLRPKRSYVVMKSKEIKKSPNTPFWLKHYKEAYSDFVNELIAQGIESKEIKERPYLTERYGKAFWFQLLFVLDFWSNDNSADFENSDAAIEKAVDLSFKLLGESTLDSALDLGKFIWQSRG